MRFSQAQAAIPTPLRTPSLAWMADRWLSTVVSEMNSSAAISRLVQPPDHWPLIAPVTCRQRVHVVVAATTDNGMLRIMMAEPRAAGGSIWRHPPGVFAVSFILCAYVQ
jgi:hypothetical protein